MKTSQRTYRESSKVAQIPAALASPIRAAESARPARAKVAAVHVPQASVLLYLVDAWVLRVEGATGIGRRVALLAVITLLAGIVWFCERQLGPRSISIARLVSGLIFLVTAGPILASYLDKQGLHGSRTTGLLAVAGGLMLTVGGAVGAIRSLRGKRKLLVIPVALVAAQFVLLPLGMAVLVTNAARPTLPARMPSDFGLTFEDVEITASDGTALVGWYLPSRNGSAVLLRHGSGSTRVNTLEHARFLSAAGYGVLMMDARGHGQSEGRVNEIGWHGPQDITASLDYLIERPDVQGRIGALGLSMGGEELLMAAAADPRLAVIVAEGLGVGNYNDSVLNGGHAVARAVNWTQFALVDLLSDASQPPGIGETVDRIAPRPVLLISGSPPNEDEMASAFARRGGHTVEHWRLADSPHTDGLKTHRREYIDRVTSLFDEHL